MSLNKRKMISINDNQEKRKNSNNDEENNIDLSHLNSKIKPDSESNSSNKVLVVSTNCNSSKNSQSLVNGTRRIIKTSKTLDGISVKRNKESKTDQRVRIFLIKFLRKTRF